MQEEIRSLGFKQDEGYAQQQVGMEGRVIQRNVEILLQSADTVEHRVAVGVQRGTGFFPFLAILSNTFDALYAGRTFVFRGIGR